MSIVTPLSLERWIMLRRIVLALAAVLVAVPPAMDASPSEAAGAQAIDGAVASTEPPAKYLAHASRGRQLLVIGELHGSTEVPALVASVVETLVTVRPVRLGLEIPVELDGALQGYLRSQDDARDKATFLRQPFWAHRDGRSSRAMLRLITSVRALRAKGKDVEVFTMEPAYEAAAVAKAGGYLQAKEAGMTQAIRHALRTLPPRGLVVALMGNFHARDGRVPPFQGTPDHSVTEQLADVSPYVVLPSAAHSETWNCVSDACGVHVYDNGNAPRTGLPRFVAEVDAGRGPTIVTLWLAQFTASPPAVDADR